MHDARGVTSVEYALILMIIVTASTLGLNAFTLVTDGTFDSLALSFEPGGQSRDTAASASDDYYPLATADRQNAQEITLTGRSFQILEMLTLTTALCAAAWAWRILRRQRRQRQQLEETDVSADPIPATQLQNFLEKRQQILRLLTNDVSRIFESRIRVRHLMSPEVRSVKPSARQEQISELMAEHHIRHLMVCDDDGRLLGVLSNRDCHPQPGSKARDLMTAAPTSVSPDTTITIAVTMMMDKNISCLPVLEDGIVKGVLTTTDLLLSLQCSLQILMRVASDAELLEKVLGTLDAPNRPRPPNRKRLPTPTMRTIASW